MQPKVLPRKSLPKSPGRPRTAPPKESAGRSPVLSAELFSIPLDSISYLIYAPLRRAAFVANAAVVNLMVDLKEGKFNPTSDRDGMLVSFLRHLQIVDGGPEPTPVTTFRGIPRPTSVTLFLTTTCNLRCTYCYAAAGDRPAKFMSLDIARRGIDYVTANAARKQPGQFRINYHGGGEPTGNWRVMKDSLSYARERASLLGLGPPIASAASNGVLEDHQIEWVMSNLNGGVSVSFDGLPEVHDRHRTTIHGQPSSDRVMRTLRCFDAARYRYGIRMTVTADQIHRLADSVEFICSTLRAKRIQIEPAHQLGRWAESPSPESDEFISAFRESQDRASRYGREVFFSAARLGTLTNHFCGVTQDTFALSPDGNVSACYEVFSEADPHAAMFFYARPAVRGRGYRFNMTALNRIRSQTVERRYLCHGCYARWSCAGDCYHKTIMVCGQGEFRGTDRCHITRELTKDQILARIAAAGGLYWQDSTQPLGQPAE